MSAASPATRQLAPKGDPTRTQPIATKYGQRLRGQLGHLNAAIRRGIDQNDVFGLRLDVLQPIDSPPPFRFETDGEQVELFMRWLDRQVDRGILEVVGTDENPFVRRAYSQAVQDADRVLNAEGVQVPEQDLQAVFNSGVYRNSLESLYTRNFENLTGITDDMAAAIREELTDGLSRGLGPRQTARNLTDRVDAIGKRRATVLARTETINAYSEGTLDRFEDFGVTRVTVRAEWLSAGDDRVCPICQTLDGEVWETQTIRTGSFQFDPGESDPDHLAGTYPIKPPAHPSCRCRLLPAVA